MSIHVNAGEIVGLLGPNGAGKTTTFNMVVGVVPPDEGAVRFLNEVVGGSVGNVFQSVARIEDLRGVSSDGKWNEGQKVVLQEFAAVCVLHTRIPVALHVDVCPGRMSKSAGTDVVEPLSVDAVRRVETTVEVEILQRVASPQVALRRTDPFKAITH